MNEYERISPARVKLVRFHKCRYEAAQREREAIFNVKYTPPNFTQLAIIANGIGSAAFASSIHHALFFTVISTGWLIRIFVIVQ